MSPFREPDDLDRAVRDVVQQTIESAGKAAKVQHEWSTGGDMWFVHVKPTVDGPAPMWIGSSTPENELNIAVGDTWFEFLGVRNRERARGFLAGIVEAVLAGKIEESGPKRARFARIHTRTGPIHVGALSLPLPWRWRISKRHYPPYADR